MWSPDETSNPLWCMMICFPRQMPSTGMPKSSMFLSMMSSPSLTDPGPPERIIPWGFIFSISSAMSFMSASIARTPIAVSP